MTDKQKLIELAIRLTALGYEVEYKRSIVARMAEGGIEPTMELFRAIDKFNVAKIDFDVLEKEYAALRNKIVNPKK